MNLHIISIIFITCIRFAHFSPNNIVVNQSISDQSVILKNIVTNYLKKYFSDENIFVSIIITSEKTIWSQFEADFFDNLFNDSILTDFSYNVLNTLNGSVCDNKNAFNLILVDNSNSLSAVVNETTVHQYRLTQKFLIVITDIDPTVRGRLDEAFQILWKNGLTYSHVLTMDDNQLWSIYTYLPYQKGCQSLTSVKVAIFTHTNSSTFMTQHISQLYPYKFVFNRCPIYVAVQTNYPFSFGQNTSNGEIMFKGIEVDLIDVASVPLNLTIMYKLSLSEDAGMHYENGTPTEPTIWVLKGEMNMTVAGYMLTKFRADCLLPSNSYLQASMGFVYKETNVQLSSLTKLTAPFRKRLWITITVILISTIPIILLSKRMSKNRRHFYIGGRMNRTPLLNSWASVLGYPISNQFIVSGRYIGSFARTLFLLWNIMWLIVRNAYQGSLYRFLQENRLQSPYDTVEKVATSNCRILSPASKYPFVQHLLSRDRILESDMNPLTRMRYLHDSGINAVILTNDLAKQYFNLVNYPNRRLAFTKDRIFMYTPTFFYRKTSIFADPFNIQLGRIQASGLLNFFIGKYTDNRKSKPHKEPSKIQIQHIYGAFELCGFMLFVSFGVFILERMSVTHQKIKYYLDFFTY